MLILVEVVQTASIEARRASNDPVDFIAFLKQ